MKKLIGSVCCLAIGAGLLAFKPVKKEYLKLNKEVKDNFAYIPAGEVYINKEPTKTGDFFISKCEVNNLQYREFLSDLAKNDKTADLKIARVDSLKWEVKAYAENYHLHPAYNYYPAVNISYEAAVLYCNWLTEKMNKDSQNNVQYLVRLPSRKEWIRAAQGDANAEYAWSGKYLRSNDGEFRANFKSLGSENIHYNPDTKQFEIIKLAFSYDKNSVNDKYDLTSDVKSYRPGVNGIYNMNGNVAEMVSEKNTAVGGSWQSTGYDIRNESTITYTAASTTVGFRPLIIVVSK